MSKKLQVFLAIWVKFQSQMLLTFLNSKPLEPLKFTTNAILKEMFGTDFARICPVMSKNHLAEFAAHSFLGCWGPLFTYIQYAPLVPRLFPEHSLIPNVVILT